MPAAATKLAPIYPLDRSCPNPGAAVPILPDPPNAVQISRVPEADMRNLLATLPALILAGSLAAQQPQPGHSPVAHAASARSADERQLFALEDGWATALVRRDTAYFRRTLAPAYLYSDERGVEDKDQVLREMTSVDDTVEYAANEEMHAHVYGTTGIVTGILVSRGHGKNGVFQHRYRFTDTWIKRGGRWVMVASQDYDIPAG